mmetsp:Transcript_4015/g.8476  ORF Transcript_4015/g.8476 Transcript_4015/m.8476 type:complete len:198 (+) Transcript_4015:176-769(+)
MRLAEKWYVFVVDFCDELQCVGVHFYYRLSLSLYSMLTPNVVEFISFSNAQWDPCGLSDYVPADWARRAELSNGRSAMLATVGWFFPKIFGTFDSTDVTTTDPIDAILQADPQWWCQFIVICGVFESWKYNQEMSGKSFLGGAAPAVDYLKLWPEDAAKQEELKLKELKNARLAMIGIAGLVSNHLLPGSCPVPPGF